MNDVIDTESAQPSTKYCLNTSTSANSKDSSAVMPVTVPVTVPERFTSAGAPNTTRAAGIGIDQSPVTAASV